VCLTEDDTYVAEMVRAGAMTPEDAATSKRRNQLVRAVGVEERVEVQTRVVATEPGDVYLLSSDGLHAVIGDDAIADVLRAEGDLARAAQRLIERALAKGGPDNATAVIVRIG
jgi:serine/threonine protein phosphatase PrpC